MSTSLLLPTAQRKEAFAGLAFHIEGELVPVLEIELGKERVYFQHHTLLWKDTAVEVGVMRMRGVIKRIFAGMPVFLTQAKGPGRVSFSRDVVGQVTAIPMEPGQMLDVRRHQWLAATSSIDYSFYTVRGIANIVVGGSGIFIDKFTCRGPDGILWLQGYGNLFEMELAAGEQIDLEPGAWVYKDHSVHIQTVVQKITSGMLASAQIFWNRFTGPGRLGIQSMYIPNATIASKRW